ncbi:unnamed protein product [Rhizophagus irregularis]|nr:unnamed protein product [Rhizophagus irregularis]
MTGFIVSNLFIVFIIIHILLLFVCPFLEIWKLKLFSDNQLSTNLLEYIYLALISYQIVMHVIICCFFNWLSSNGLKLIFIVSGILWLIIPAIYTHFTINELGNVPFLCSQLICKIRATNLIIMWIGFITIFFMTICIVFFENEKLNLLMGKKRKINNNKKQKRPRKNSKCSEVGAKLVSLDNDVES